MDKPRTLHNLDESKANVPSSSWPYDYNNPELRVKKHRIRRYNSADMTEFKSKRFLEEQLALSSHLSNDTGTLAGPKSPTEKPVSLAGPPQRGNTIHSHEPPSGGDIFTHNLESVDTDIFEAYSEDNHETPGVSPNVDEPILADLEAELIEAAFVVCWPTGQCTHIRSLDTVPDRTWNGDYMFSVSDSDLADAWVDENYDHALLAQIRERKIGGPIPTMLSIFSAALAIFGKMEVSLIRVAEQLADFSGFPVIVRPLEEDPSRFRSHAAGHTTAANINQVDGNATHGGTTQWASSVQSGGEGRRTYNDPSPKKLGKQREGDRDSDNDSDEEEPGASPPPPPPPPLPNYSKEVVHKTDVNLKLSNNAEGHFLRVITKVKLYPPNAKDQVAKAKWVCDPSIEGHVDLQIRSGGSIDIYNTLGSVGFLSHSTDYLQTEYLVPLGYSAPRHRVKRTMGDQSFSTFGEVSEQWLVSPLRMDCTWNTETSRYRGLNTIIQRNQVPTCHPVDVQAKYGIAVEVAKPVDKVTPIVSFIYRHQIHCWAAVNSKSRVRGLIVLAAHFIPDIRTEKGLWIEHRPVLDLPNMNIQKGSEPEDNSASSKQAIVVQRTRGEDETSYPSQGTSKDVSDVTLLGPPSLPEDHFALAATATPLTEKVSQVQRWAAQTLKWNRKQAPTSLPVSTLVSHGLQRKPIGWDHTNMKWYYPVWPELDRDFGRSSEDSSAMWRLDGHDPET